MLGILIIGSLFGLLAAAAAFLITFEEYSHHYPDKRRPLRAAVNMAVFTFVFLMFLTFCISLVIKQIM